MDAPFDWTPPLRLTRSMVRRALARRHRGGARQRHQALDTIAHVMELRPEERRALRLSSRDRARLWAGVVVGPRPWQQLWRELGRFEEALGWAPRQALLFLDDDYGGES